MSGTRDVTDWPGALVETPEHREQVLAKHGPQHIRTCVDCQKDFFSRRLVEPRCYGCWYGWYMDRAEGNYAWTFALIRECTGLEAWMDQTGGMCLAIHVKVADGRFFWLTDEADSLSLTPREEDGWTLGYYDHTDEEDDDCGMPKPLTDDEEMLSCERKDPFEALRLVRRALELLGEAA